MLEGKVGNSQSVAVMVKRKDSERENFVYFMILRNTTNDLSNQKCSTECGGCVPTCVSKRGSREARSHVIEERVGDNQTATAIEKK